MQTTTPSTHLHRLFIILFVLLFVFFMYTFLHELGHASLGVIFGQSLTEFNVKFWDFSAHVGMNGDLTQPQLALQAVAGATLPLLVWAFFISVVPRKASFILEVLKLISSLAVVNTVLVWIAIPTLYLLGNAPPSDDVTHFLRFSGMQPLLLMLVALIVYIRGWALFLSRIEGVRSEFLLFRIADRETLMAGAHTVLPVMTGIVTFAVVFAFLLNDAGLKNPQTRLVPPADYEVVAEIDLSSQTYAAQPLAEFTVTEPTWVGVFIVVRDINTSYFDLSVVGPGEYTSVVLHGEGYRAERDGGLWEENLLPGTYQLVLTSNQSPGTAAVFLNTH